MAINSRSWKIIMLSVNIFLTYIVFILLPRSRHRYLPISLLSSIQVAIVAERITKCTFSDFKFNENSGGNTNVLVHSLS